MLGVIGTDKRGIAMTEATLDTTKPCLSDEPVAKQRADLFKRLEKTPTCLPSPTTRTAACTCA